MGIDGSSVEMKCDVLEIKSDGFSFMRERGGDEWFVVYAAFGNVTSVGMSGHMLMVFIGDQENEEEEETP